MPDLSQALFEDSHGTRIAIEVTAGAKAESFPAGYNEWRKVIGCRVAAPALEGRANKAVIALVSGTLKVPASSVSIQSGQLSSLKKVLVSGMKKEDALHCLEQFF
ncbi:MAG TPA: YggU family protein [Methanoregula sp.]|nr:YggU family protein [Methanoregula sp.]